jgi:hypothetical protein
VDECKPLLLGVFVLFMHVYYIVGEGPCNPMTQCVKPFRRLATSITKLSKGSVLIFARTKSDQVALSQTKCLSGLAHFAILLQHLTTTFGFQGKTLPMHYG